MTKMELIKEVSDQAEISHKDAENAVNATLSSVSNSLKKGNDVEIRGFGNFVVRKRAKRTARNPRTGETIQVKARKVVAFKAAKSLKDDVA